MAKSAKTPAPSRTQRAVSGVKSRTRGKEAKAAKPTSTALGLRGPAAKASGHSDAAKSNKLESGTKQSRVLLMLQAPAGATIAALMQATGWQQHSVRGFLAGVVRKRLRLKLTSKKMDGARVYKISSAGDAKACSAQPKRRAA